MRRTLLVFTLIITSLCSLGHAFALTVAPSYAERYTATSLGSVPGLQDRYGGLTFKAGDPNTILIGDYANTADGGLYSIGVSRDGSGHITGFSGTASYFAEAAYNDGGVVYGPGNVLFLARWPNNQIGQTKPGSTVTDKIVDLGPLGVTGSPGGLSFVPSGFPGAGTLKLVSYNDGTWYDLAIAPDEFGTYDITSATYKTTIGGGPEGIFYVPTGSPVFGTTPSLLVSEYTSGNVAAYGIDSNGDPILETRNDFITGIYGAEGAAVDPLTGDFLFSTFGGGDQVILVKGFVPPPPPPTGAPEPTTMLLLGLGLMGLAGIRRKFSN